MQGSVGARSVADKKQAQSQQKNMGPAAGNKGNSATAINLQVTSAL